jgi:hypothetical protein
MPNACLQAGQVPGADCRRSQTTTSEGSQPRCADIGAAHGTIVSFYAEIGTMPVYIVYSATERLTRT